MGGFRGECSRNKSDRALIMFLESYGQSLVVYDRGGARDFVRELHRRWTKRQYPGPVTLETAQYNVEDMTPGSVFVSYAREDGQAAMSIYDTLIKKCDVWLDRQRLKGGDPFEAKIMHSSV